MFKKSMTLAMTVFGIVSLAGLSSGIAAVCQPLNTPYWIENGTFEVTEYKPEKPGIKTLLIIPPTGGTNYIDKSYAKAFCKAGFEVFLVNDWPRPGESDPAVEVHQIFYGNAQAAIRKVLEAIKTPYIGILGTSVGALHASISLTSLPELDAGFLIVGGLPIAEVVVTSDQQAMRDLHATRQKLYHFKSDEENIQAIQKVFSLEPTKQPQLVQKRDVGVVTSTEDRTVPYPTHQKLQAFFKPEKVIALQSSHFWAIVKTWLFHTDEIVTFFEESFKKQNVKSE